MAKHSVSQPGVPSSASRCRSVLVLNHAFVAQIKLRSSDDEVFDVPEEVAVQSLTLKNMIDGDSPPY